MPKNTLSLLIAASLVLGACAAAKPKDASVDAGAARAAANAHPGSVGPGNAAAPTLVGPDIIVALPVDNVWKTLSDVQNWGVWNTKVTAVEPGAGLNVGTELAWTWEEKKIQSVITAVKEDELLTVKGCKTGSDVSLRWTLHAMDDSHTVISLRAELKPNANPTLIANAAAETGVWISALNDEMTKQAAALAPAPPVKKAKKSKKKPVPAV
jgi:hypothetical protein